MKVINCKRQSLISVSCHSIPTTSAVVGMTSALGFSYLVDICFFPATCSVGFYRIWVNGEIKYRAAQEDVQTCVTEPAASQA